ncbi:MAG: zinc-ribbon domain-containing protein [Candidatus Izemoplasma sp.]|nr:zinc-ribbon domain-containing protein [Candidatus Izemoplasma sp.]
MICKHCEAPILDDTEKCPVCGYVYVNEVEEAD